MSSRKSGEGAGGGKCDIELYRKVLETKLTPSEDFNPECDFDVDLLVSSLNTTLYSAATPKNRPRKKRMKQHTNCGMMP